MSGPPTDPQTIISTIKKLLREPDARAKLMDYAQYGTLPNPSKVSSIGQMTEQLPFQNNIAKMTAPIGQIPIIPNQVIQPVQSVRVNNKELSPPVLEELPLCSPTVIFLRFNQGSNGGKPITNYQYSLDNGATFTLFEPAQYSSPIIIIGLKSDTEYQIQLRAVTSAGISAASNTVICRTKCMPTIYQAHDSLK